MHNLVNSLKELTSFHLNVFARTIIFAKNTETFISAWRYCKKHDEPFLVIGEGSNTLFLNDFVGTIVVNQIPGISIREESDAWHLHVGSGERWHDLVTHTLNNNIPGLENLALIPGTVGAAPIQNIGAYGVEFKDVCEYVDILELKSGRCVRLMCAECRFAYRDSIFKHQFRQGYVIIAVGLILRKAWRAELSYGELKQIDPATATSQLIYNQVCSVRKAKLPNPKIIGNAGSFFKNPVVTSSQAKKILLRYAQTPHYRQSDGHVKLAAGWLIDFCQLKGHQVGGAAIHCHQALVIINKNNATSQDIVTLARHVRHCVHAVFSLWLEPEVRFIDKRGEVSAQEVLT